MKNIDINAEINTVKIVMENLLACVKDAAVSTSDKKKYYSDYLQQAAYLLQLQRVKPAHSMTIVR